MSGESSQSAQLSKHGLRSLPPLQPTDDSDVPGTGLAGQAQQSDRSDRAVPVADSPAAFSSQASPSPQSATLRSRKTKSPTTRGPRIPQAVRSKQQSKQTYSEDKSILIAFRRSILHILSITITGVILVLCATETYMSDLTGFPGQDIILQALQFVVKGHEILMAMSLGDIVLHRIRYDLILRAGVPFGLLTSAYQLGDLGYLCSAQFRAAIRRHHSRDLLLSRHLLALLVIVTSLLCLVAGPSTGVLLIPRLSWWPLKRPFGGSNMRLFAANSTEAQVWPQTLPSYDGSGWLYGSIGASAIGAWAFSLPTNNAPGQIPFIDGGDDFYRWLISNYTDFDGWTISTTPMMSMKTIVGEYWNWITLQDLAPTVSLTQPKLELSFADRGEIFQPLVQAQCAMHYGNTSQAGFSLPNNRLASSDQNAYSDLTWPILSSYGDIELSNYTGNIFWSKVSLENYESAPSLGLVFVLLDENESRVIVPCSFVAHWVPSDLYIIPKSDPYIHVTYANPIDILNRPNVILFPSNQITFSDQWWNSLFTTPSPSMTPIEDMLRSISQPLGPKGMNVYFGGSQGLPYRMSTMMSMLITDAIARYVHVDSTRVMFEDNPKLSMQFAQSLSGVHWPDVPGPKDYPSWLKYADANPQIWRDATPLITGYGYAWSFKGVLSKFAGVALALHAIIAFVHIVLVVQGRWSSSAWDSIGNMIALALRSRSPAFPLDRRTGDEKKETWAATVSVRVVENELELMFNPTRAETLRLLQR